MSRVLVAGVDTSTQSCKVRVTDAATGELVRFGQAKHPDGSTVNPEHWWRAFQEAASQAGGLDDVSAIAVGGQQHGMVALDEQGRVIRDAMLWNDTSSAPQAEALIDGERGTHRRRLPAARLAELAHRRLRPSAAGRKRASRRPVHRPF